MPACPPTADEQLNSLGNQIQYYEDFIRRNAAWTFVPGYIDEGLSGISTKRRENFNRMIDDAAEDTFDLIITKEISRFARNTLDSIQYTRGSFSAAVWAYSSRTTTSTRSTRTPNCACPSCPPSRRTSCASCQQPREIRPSAGHQEQCCARQQPHFRLPKGEQAALSLTKTRGTHGTGAV